VLKIVARLSARMNVLQHEQDNPGLLQRFVVLFPVILSAIFFKSHELEGEISLTFMTPFLAFIC
jgi:hypothetical protein